MSTLLYYDQECGNLNKAAFCLKSGPERIAPTVHAVSLTPTPTVFQVPEQTFVLEFQTEIQDSHAVLNSPSKQQGLGVVAFGLFLTFCGKSLPPLVVRDGDDHARQCLSCVITSGGMKAISFTWRVILFKFYFAPGCFEHVNK